MERMYNRDGYSENTQRQQEVLLDDFDHILDAIYIYKKVKQTICYARPTLKN